MKLVTLQILFFAALINASTLFAGEITIDLSPGYANDVWFSIENGVVKSAPKDDWDIAFQGTGVNGGVRINGQKGMEMWVVPNSNPDDNWEGPTDTTGIASWDTYINSVDSWNIGAFNLNLDGLETEFGDYGWGDYYPDLNHSVVANKFFVIKLKNGTYKKFIIDILINFEYTFRLANLDGSEEVEVTVKKKQTPDSPFKNYIYYSIENNQLSYDREPALDEWDFVFGKYQTWYPTQDGTFMKYPLTGVRTKPGYLTAKLEGVDPKTATAPEFESGEYKSGITQIGADWKALQEDFTYKVHEDWVYFITERNEDNPTAPIYRIYFTSFEGSSTGAFSFVLEEEAVSSVEIDGRNVGNFSVYPNIIEAGNGFNLVANFSAANNFNLSVVDLNGNKVYQQNLNTTDNLEVHNILGFDAAPGLYMVVLESNGNISTQKLIVK